MSDLRALLMDEIQDGTALNSIFEVEELLLLIGDINKKVDFYKDLRRYRTEVIDAKIGTLAQKGDVLRQVILNTMQKLAPDEKTVHFPAIGKVSRRTPKDAWQVDDQDKLTSFLDKKGDKSEVTRVTEAIDKRKLNALLDKYKKEGVAAPGVSIKIGVDSLTITLEKKDEAAGSRVPAYSSDIDLDDLDSLEV